MKITDFIEGKVTYDNYGQYFWVNDASEGQQMLAELRGWGRIQNMFQSKGKYDLEGAEKFQDELGEWVASAINEKLEREKEQSLLTKPAVINNEAAIASGSANNKIFTTCDDRNENGKNRSEVAACGDCYYAGDCDSATLNERCKHFMANF